MPSSATHRRVGTVARSGALAQLLTDFDYLTGLATPGPCERLLREAGISALHTEMFSWQVPMASAAAVWTVIYAPSCGTGEIGLDHRCYRRTRLPPRRQATSITPIVCRLLTLPGDSLVPCRQTGSEGEDHRASWNTTSRAYQEEPMNSLLAGVGIPDRATPGDDRWQTRSPPKLSATTLCPPSITRWRTRPPPRAIGYDFVSAVDHPVRAYPAYEALAEVAAAIQDETQSLARADVIRPGGHRYAGAPRSLGQWC